MSLNITQTFAKQGYTVDETTAIKKKGKLVGCVAKSDTVKNTITKENKKVFYVAGSGYDMGHMIGTLAPEDAYAMVHQFPLNMIMNMLPEDWNPLLKKWIAKKAFDVLKDLSKQTIDDIPQPLIDEMKGLADAVNAAKVGKEIDWKDVLTLNVGFDVITAFLSNPIGGFADLLKEIAKHELAVGIHSDYFTGKKPFLKPPCVCIAFSAFGKATEGGNQHFFGRDFQFSPAGIYQNVAATIIYVPDDGRIPLLSVGAPGFIGSITAMNAFGIAMGVDTAAASNSNPEKVGLNSLLLVRHTIHTANSGSEVVDIVKKAPRGVPWIYPFSDGTNDKSGVIEAGMKTDKLDPWLYVGPELKKKKLVPTPEYMEKHTTEKPVKGLIVRWADYKYPQEFIKDFNHNLFKHFEKVYKNYSEEEFLAFFGETNYIFPSFIDNVKERPGIGFSYFSPQREIKEDIVITTNLFINPWMALCGMNWWVSLVMEKFHTDIQWKYDEINRIIHEHYGKLDYDLAWKTINFLNPNVRGTSDYQSWMPNELTIYDVDKSTFSVDAAICLMDLKVKKLKVLYGYYKDEPLELELMPFLE